MSYSVQANIAQDMQLFNRITACAAGEGIADPFQWTEDHKWQLATTAGWAEGYESSNPESGVSPGLDEDAITDPMILEAVQRIIATSPPPPTQPDTSPAE